MQNIKKYFGFKVMLSDFLEPTDYTLIRNEVARLVREGLIDISRYRIYLHQLVLAADTAHFGVGGGLENRVSQIYLNFSINQKQRRSGDIQFVNHLFNKELHEDIRHFYMAYEIGYTIPAAFFRDRDWFQNILVTLVRDGIREDYKKIKVRVKAEPAGNYEERLYRKLNANSETRLDLRFNRVIEFNRQTRLFVDLPARRNPEEKAMSKKSEPSSTTINISGGTVTGFAVNSPNPQQTMTVRISTNPELLEHLVKELQTLVSALEKDSFPGVSAKDVGILEGVIVEAPKNPKAIERLKSVGRWLGRSSEKIGLSLLTSYIKGEIGL